MHLSAGGGFFPDWFFLRRSTGVCGTGKALPLWEFVVDDSPEQMFEFLFSLAHTEDNRTAVDGFMFFTG